MSKRRVKAFTILEVTIVMMITSLLIGITYTSYSIIVKSYLSFTEKNKDQTVLTNLDYLLRRDFEQANIIRKEPDGVSLQRESGIIKYQIKPEYILREGIRTDTFKVETQDLSTLFENVPINDVQTIDEQNRIDELQFTLIYKNDQIPCYYHKLYSSSNLIQRNPNAGN